MSVTVYFINISFVELWGTRSKQELQNEKFPPSMELLTGTSRLQATRIYHKHVIHCPMTLFWWLTYTNEQWKRNPHINISRIYWINFHRGFLVISCIEKTDTILTLLVWTWNVQMCKRMRIFQPLLNKHSESIAKAIQVPYRPEHIFKKHNPYNSRSKGPKNNFKSINQNAIEHSLGNVGRTNFCKGH